MAAPARARKVPVCLGPFVLRTQRFSSRGSAVAPKRGREVAPAAQSVWHTSFPLEAQMLPLGSQSRIGSPFGSVHSVRGPFVWERGVRTADIDSSFSTVGARPGLDPAPHGVCG